VLGGLKNEKRPRLSVSRYRLRPQLTSSYALGVPKRRCRERRLIGSPSSLNSSRSSGFASPPSDTASRRRPVSYTSAAAWRAIGLVWAFPVLLFLFVGYQGVDLDRWSPSSRAPMVTATMFGPQARLFFAELGFFHRSAAKEKTSVPVWFCLLRREASFIAGRRARPPFCVAAWLVACVPEAELAGALATLAFARGGLTRVSRSGAGRKPRGDPHGRQHQPMASAMRGRRCPLQKHNQGKRRVVFR